MEAPLRPVALRGLVGGDRDGRAIRARHGRQPLADEGRTRIGVHVDIPEREAHRLEAQRGVISASLRSLAALAETG